VIRENTSMASLRHGLFSGRQIVGCEQEPKCVSGLQDPLIP
jgi:hypothetical protein